LTRTKAYTRPLLI